MGILILGKAVLELNYGPGFNIKMLSYQYRPNLMCNNETPLYINIGTKICTYCSFGLKRFYELIIIKIHEA